MTVSCKDHLDGPKAAIALVDQNKIDKLDSEVMPIPESSLYQELGLLTREIHESIKNFADDDRLVALARDEIPDAKERLNLIVSMTEDAAHRSMSIAEETVSMMLDFKTQTQQFSEQWQKFRNTEPSKQNLADLNVSLDRFLETVGNQSQDVCGKMTEIMLAQDYQDITGQIIRKVVIMVQDVEEKLLRLVTITGKELQTENSAEADSGEIAVGPQLPSASRDKVAKSQEDVDDLLASLGF